MEVPGNHHSNPVHRPTIDRPAVTQALSELSDTDAAAFECDRDEDLNYYVELAGAFSIRYPTAEETACDEAWGGSQRYEDRETLRRRAEAVAETTHAS